jgi:Ca-activated chloride channel family protein
VYAIGVGSEQGVPIPQDVHPIYGVRYRRKPDGTLERSRLDVKTLQQIARLSGGQFFKANDPTTLQRVYSDIWKMEKSKFEVRAYQRYRELFGYFLWPGLGLLLLEVVLGQTWLRKVP